MTELDFSLLHRPNKLRSGIFSAHCDDGPSMSMAPERGPAKWDEILEPAKATDRAGFDVIPSVASAIALPRAAGIG